ncbi:thymidylate synthase [Patescibacteria group bacterium]
MNRFYKAQSINDAFLWAAKQIKNNPDFSVSPREMATREILSVVLQITNPYNRIVKNKHRKISLKYLIGEWLWYERASNLLSEIAYYSSFWKKISDDGQTANSAYGYRIKGCHLRPEMNQWKYVKRQLLSDQNTRRAVIFIASNSDVREKTKDFPCTMFLQFLIRNKKLHLICNMRSNDLILGFCYDVATFTIFQEKMLLELKMKIPDLEMGHYFHFASSMHAYERHYKMIDEVLKNPTDNFKIDMPKMERLSEIKKLQTNEAIIRTGSKKPLLPLNDKFCSWCQTVLLDR